MRIVYAPEAVDDLEAAVAYVARDNPAAAARLADRVFDRIDSLAAGEFDGPEHVLRSGESVRSWPVPPFRVYYRRSEGLLEILRVYHHARRPIVR